MALPPQRCAHTIPDFEKQSGCGSNFNLLMVSGDLKGFPSRHQRLVNRSGVLDGLAKDGFGQLMKIGVVLIEQYHSPVFKQARHEASECVAERFSWAVCFG